MPKTVLKLAIFSHMLVKVCTMSSSDLGEKRMLESKEGHKLTWVLHSGFDTGTWNHGSCRQI